MVCVSTLAAGAAGCGDIADENVSQVEGNLTVANGLTANGLTANGLTANGLAANGLTANGLAANGLAANGLAANGLAANGLAANGLAANGLAANGLAANGLAANGLAANGLAANGLAANGLAANGLADPAAHEFMEYVVSCALPAGEEVTYVCEGVTYTFAGALGLAPQWQRQACDLSCQRWVSACVLARLNKLGVHREISIRGDNDALALVEGELEKYPEREATYFGNLFQPAQQRYACLPPGVTTIPRVCGNSLATCAIRVVGECAKVCREEAPDGTYQDCAPRATTNVKSDDRYAETITVFLGP